MACNPLPVAVSGLGIGADAEDTADESRARSDSNLSTWCCVSVVAAHFSLF